MPKLKVDGIEVEVSQGAHVAYGCGVAGQRRVRRDRDVLTLLREIAP